MIILRWLWFIVKYATLSVYFLGLLMRDVLRDLNPDLRAQGAYGTARWATAWEKIRFRVYRGHGPVVGSGWFGRLMRFNRDGIVQVFARNGSGKGIGVVVPTLLDYPGSIVVTDVKGENYAITARHRATMGQVHMLNPSDLRRSARFNPLDMIRVGTDQESDDAQALANFMVIRDSGEQHWSDKSISLLSCLILHAVNDPNEDNRTLAYVRKLSLGAEHSMHETVEDIARTSPSALARNIARAFTRTMGTPNKPMPEFASILSDLDKATEPWSEGTPTGALSSHSTFHLEELNGQETVTLYLCVDEEKLEAYRRWLRVMTGCTLNALMRSKRTRRPKHKVVLLLDEARALGRLEPLVNAIGFLRAYCTPVLIWQNMAQARAIYGASAAEFLANVSCRVFFGVSDNDTAHEVSKLCGQRQVYSRSQNVSHQSDAWLRENHSHGESEGGYWLIDPAEVQRLPDNVAVVKMGHVPFPMLTKRANYLNRLRWMFRYDRWTPDDTPPVRGQPPRAPSPPSSPEARPPSEAAPGPRLAF
jgi:type IV secretion system protein VirD4